VVASLPAALIRRRRISPWLQHRVAHLAAAAPSPSEPGWVGPVAP
jgi:hypothetical protein